MLPSIFYYIYINKKKEHICLKFTFFLDIIYFITVIRRLILVNRKFSFNYFNFIIFLII
jgi:hypothetical protein